MVIKNIKLFLSDRRMLIVLLALVMFAVIGAVFAKPDISSPKVRFGIADSDDSKYSRMLIDFFEENENFSSYITLIRGQESELSKMLDEGEIDLYLYIPKEFAERLMNIDNIPIRAVIDGSDLTKAVLYKNLLNSYASYISAVEVNAQAVYDIMKQEGYDYEERSDVNYHLSYDLIFTALGKDDFFEHKELERIEGVPLVNYYVSSGIVLLVMYAGLIAGLSFLKERKSLSYQRIKVAGKSGASQFFAKLVSCFLLFGAAFSVLLAVINISGKMHFSSSSVFFVLSGLLVSCTFFMLISCFMETVGGYSIFANMLILLLTVIGGGIIPIMYLPEAVAKVACFTPNYWFIRTLI